MADKRTGEIERVEVEVAYARPEIQVVVALQVRAGTTVREAVQLSGIRERFPEIDLRRNRVGIFGRLVRPGRTLEAGDRVEIYRPLQADPKTVRRRRAGCSRRGR